MPKHAGRGAILLISALTLAAAGPDRRLVDAARDRDVEAVRAFLEQQVDVDLPQADGATALHWAVYWDDAVTADLLLAAGAEVDPTNDLGVTPLSLACTNGSSGMVTRLLEAGASPRATLRSGETALMTASRTGNIEVVELLLKAGADIDVQELTREQTALMWAVSEGHLEVATALLDAGADIDARSGSGFTALLFAARLGDLELAQRLLDRGADPNDTATDGTSALLVATVRGRTDLALLLLDEGAAADAGYDLENGAGYTPLHWAAGSWETEMTGPNGILTPPEHEWSAMRGVQIGKLELVEALLEKGADPNARLTKNPPRSGYTVFSRRPKGSTPFYLAAMAGEAEIMRALAMNGADPLLMPEDGTTPLMTAAGVSRALAESRVSDSRSLLAVQLAYELGGNVNAANEIGETALHGAARIRSDSIAQFLIDKGAEVNVQNNRGQSPLFIAERYFHPGSPPLVERTSTGDLLRRHSVPPAVAQALGNWDLLPSNVRAEVEALLEGALQAEKNPWIDVNPVLPDRFGVPNKTEKPLRAATDPGEDD